MKTSVVNYILFQAGWFACVLGAGNGIPMLGPMVVAIAVLVHLGQAGQPRREAALILVCAALGLVFDSLLLATGWIGYPNGSWVPGFAPYWIVALWVIFGTTLNLSMSWMHGRSWLAFLMGVIGGPLSYLAGQKLGAINLVDTIGALSALAIGWGLMMPVLVKLSLRFNGFQPIQLPAFVDNSWVKERPSYHA